MAKKKADATGAKKTGEQSAKPITKADISQFLMPKKAPQTQASSQTSVQAEAAAKLSNIYQEGTDAELWHACRMLRSWHPTIDNKELYAKAKAVSGGFNKLKVMKDYVFPILTNSINSAHSDQLFAIQQVCWISDDEGQARAGLVMKVVPWDFQFIAILLDQKPGYKLEYIPISNPKRTKIDSVMVLDTCLRHYLESLFAQYGSHLVNWLVALSNQMLSEMIPILGASGDFAAASFARDVLHIRESVMFQTSHKLDMFQAQEPIEAKAHFLMHLHTGIPLCTPGNECKIENMFVGQMKIVKTVSSLLNEDFARIQARCSTQISIPMTLRASLVKIALWCVSLSRIYPPTPFMLNLYWLMAEVLEIIHEESGADLFWEPCKYSNESNGDLYAAKQADELAKVQPKAPLGIVYEISESVFAKAQKQVILILARYGNNAEQEVQGLVHRYPIDHGFGEAKFRRRPFDGTPGTNLLAAQWPRSSSADAVSDASLRNDGEKQQQQQQSQNGDEAARGVLVSDFGGFGRNNSLEYDWLTSFGGLGSHGGGNLHSPLTHPNEDLYEDIFRDEGEPFDWGDDLGFSGHLPTTNARPALRQQDPFFNDDYTEPPPPPPYDEPPSEDSFAFHDRSGLSMERTRVFEAFGGKYGGPFHLDERPDFGTQEEGTDETRNFRLRFDNLSLKDSNKREKGDGVYQEIDPKSDTTKKLERGPPPPVPVRKYGKGQVENDSHVDV